MSWVRRRDAEQRHVCAVPVMTDSTGHTYPAGRRHDLWRCDECRKLWRIGTRCDQCDPSDGRATHLGQHAVGDKWRPARPGQRIRYWRKG